MDTWFLSDLHLSESYPQLSHAFEQFLQRRAATADAIYLLGDLFDLWIGDDDDAPLVARIGDAIARASTQTSIFWIAGNRDFLVGDSFASACAMQPLPEVSLQTIYDKRCVLLHGDTLCTDDHQYQSLRTTLRDENWQRQILAMPLAERRALGQQLRDGSRAHLKSLDAQGKPGIADATASAVAQLVQSYDPALIIHGHVHRPGIHSLGNGGHRIVLGDWLPCAWAYRMSRVDGNTLRCWSLGNSVAEISS